LNSDYAMYLLILEYDRERNICIKMSSKDYTQNETVKDNIKNTEKYINFACKNKNKN